MMIQFPYTVLKSKLQFITFGFILLLGISTCIQKSDDKQLELIQAWNTVSDFQSPESVIYDQRNECIYVTNGIGYAKNGKGFISKLSKSGEVLSLKWVDNLHRPTGMAIHNNKLYVADIDALLAIDLETGAITQGFQVVTTNPMLNDIAITENGDIYVTSSGQHGVYHLVADSLVLEYQDDEILQYANGIVIKEDEIIVAGWNMAKIEAKSKQIDRLELGTDLSDLDGLAIDQQQRLFCTTVGGKGSLWLIDAERNAELIYQQDNYLADFDLTQIDEQTYILLASGKHDSKQFEVLALLLKGH